jgi:hypothetical protein
VQELLQDLQHTVSTIVQIASGERPNRQYESEDDDEEDSLDDTNANEEQRVEAGGLLLADQSSSMNNIDMEGPEIQFSEAEELFESVKATIASLFRISILIRNASPRDRFVKALSSRRARFDETFDISHVSHKFPKVSAEDKTWLKEWLGKAITQRRQYLRYARDHRNKLGEEPADLWEPEISRTVLIADRHEEHSQTGRTEVTSMSRLTSRLAPTTASTLQLPDVELQERDMSDNMSQTSYATSLGNEDAEHWLQLPRLSDVCNESPTFECPLCWTIQNINKETLWRRHCFKDLKPYICTFEQCDLKFFSDRRDWFDHELQCHRGLWHCDFCAAEFSSATTFQKHILNQHTQHVSSDQLDALTEASKRHVDRIAALDCPLCNEWEVTLRKANPSISAEDMVVVTPAQFRHHLGSHMQQLALFALPRGLVETEDASEAESCHSTGGAKAGSAPSAVSDSRLSDTEGQSNISLTDSENLPSIWIPPSNESSIPPVEVDTSFSPRSGSNASITNLGSDVSSNPPFETWESGRAELNILPSVRHRRRSDVSPPSDRMVKDYEDSSDIEIDHIDPMHEIKEDHADATASPAQDSSGLPNPRVASPALDPRPIPVPRVGSYERTVNTQVGDDGSWGGSKIEEDWPEIDAGKDIKKTHTDEEFQRWKEQMKAPAGEKDDRKADTPANVEPHSLEDVPEISMEQLRFAIHGSSQQSLVDHRDKLMLDASSTFDGNSYDFDTQENHLGYENRGDAERESSSREEQDAAQREKADSNEARFAAHITDLEHKIAQLTEENTTLHRLLSGNKTPQPIPHTEQPTDPALHEYVKSLSRLERIRLDFEGEKLATVWFLEQFI